LVALEMARRLAEEGEAVDPVVVIRSSARNVRFGGARRIIEGGGRLLGIDDRGRQGLVRRWIWFARAWRRATAYGRLALLGAKVLRLIVRPGGGAHPAEAAAHRPDDREALIDTFTNATADHVPLPYPGRVVVLWPAEESEPASEALRWWRRISPRAEIEIIPGDHLTSVTVHARDLARRLAEHLDAGSRR
jgi:thioesterase domain-containing protein